MLNTDYAKNKFSPVAEFLSYVAKYNPIHYKYLTKSIENITEEEIRKLENLMSFYGDGNLKEIAIKYLALVGSLVEEQKYFVENYRYRFSKFSEVENYYKNTDYMDSYVVGLGLSTYLWYTHRSIMRFFIKNISEVKSNGIYLEIGPGHGEYFVAAMQNTNFNKYLAVDISQSSVEMTNRFIKHSFPDGGKKYSVLLQDFFDYEDDVQFNAIVMGEVLEHVEEPLKFLRKIYDIATDDAFIYITTAINAPQLDHIYLFKNTDEIISLFNQAKLSVIDEAIVTHNNISLEKAYKKQYSIVVAYILQKQK